jgi:hypothetical protein
MSCSMGEGVQLLLPSAGGVSPRLVHESATARRIGINPVQAVSLGAPPGGRPRRAVGFQARRREGESGPGADGQAKTNGRATKPKVTGRRSQVRILSGALSEPAANRIGQAVSVAASVAD